MFTLSIAQIREVDRVASAAYGISGLVLMENAGRGVADALRSRELDRGVVVCCGKGNNAGDGFVVARHLDAHGVAVRVLLFCDPDQLTGDAASNYKILQKSEMKCELIALPADRERLSDLLCGASCLIDALLGTGAVGAPRPPLDQAIDLMNASGTPIVAIDVPSGLDAETGAPARHTIRAAQTCTFVAAKPGFATAAAAPWLGEIVVLGLGVPRKLLAEIGPFNPL
ncbi:MAG TPA: NAD(P)H-hydrate epimerase [Pirellulales bacterium]|jgi:NAD(P)H-hydrate epimerase|nr:NAD(P)H-hydrate epimerase [Pirellulales bacterium]